MKRIKEGWTQRRIITSPQRQKIASILTDPDFIEKFEASKSKRTKTIVLKPRA